MPKKKGQEQPEPERTLSGGRTSCCGTGAYSVDIHVASNPIRLAAVLSRCVGCRKRVGDARIMDPKFYAGYLEHFTYCPSGWLEETDEGLECMLHRNPLLKKKQDGEVPF